MFPVKAEISISSFSRTALSTRLLSVVASVRPIVADEKAPMAVKRLEERWFFSANSARPCSTSSPRAKTSRKVRTLGLSSVALRPGAKPGLAGIRAVGRVTFSGGALNIGLGIMGLALCAKAALASAPVTAKAIASDRIMTPLPEPFSCGKDSQAVRGAPAVINSGVQPSSADMNYKPRRFNKAIELWEDGQPVFYATERPNAQIDQYERGKAMCKTYADVINYDMEHEMFDLRSLAEFMRGLSDGGGTRSGHRMPSVFVTCPVLGLNEQYAMANSWVIGQILDRGRH